ncbi:MAG: hypothetical protein ABSE89_08020 [Sedimentisphaerales bacterium]
MKKLSNKKFVFILVLILFCTKCFALEDEIGNPAAPPSSERSGLIRSPNPITTPSGNLTVTGNVGGMNYFHGLVPYGSPTDFGAPLGSEGISSFLRLTAPISSPTRPQFLPQPYYLPSSTVSTLAPNALGTTLTYPSIRATGGTGNFVESQIPKAVKTPEISAASPLYDYSRTRPLSYEPTDLERATSLELMRKENKEKLSIALQKAGRGLHEITEEQQAKEQEENTLVPQPVKPAEPAERFKPLKPLQPDEITKVEAQKPVEDVYEQMLEEVKKSSEQQPPSQLPGGLKQPEKPEEAPSEKGGLEEIEKETAKATVEIHRSFATQSKDKFNYYMRTAEEFLKEGKYYNAVDAYTLASIYKPDDPLAYAGRSHALFASGEYMSSAYFLARAINIFPQYVDFKIDLNAMIPDANRLESRIEDIKTWIERTQSAELSFLLAYVYYQLDKNDLAAEAIKFSAGKMPDSAAVKALKQAIEKKSR